MAQRLQSDQSSIADAKSLFKLHHRSIRALQDSSLGVEIQTNVLAKDRDKEIRGPINAF